MSMKAFYTDNQALLELLSENGINPVCDSDMQMLITDEEAARVPAIVAESAPAATGDYTIEDAPIYVVIDNTSKQALTNPFATRKEAEDYIDGAEDESLLVILPTNEIYADLKSFM